MLKCGLLLASIMMMAALIEAEAVAEATAGMENSIKRQRDITSENSSDM